MLTHSFQMCLRTTLSAQLYAIKHLDEFKDQCAQVSANKWCVHAEVTVRRNLVTDAVSRSCQPPNQRMSERSDPKERPMWPPCLSHATSTGASNLVTDELGTRRCNKLIRAKMMHTTSSRSMALRVFRDRLFNNSTEWVT